MKRRNFILASAGLVGAGNPLLRAAAPQPCPPTSFAVDGASLVSASCSQPSAEADWLLRSGQDAANPQPGVVWFQDFRSDDEVDAFRWTPRYSGGNDPASRGTNASWVRRHTGDGITGGGCLEIYRAAGTTEGAQWWRPFSPLNKGGNGRLTDDPGANGSLSVQPYNATDGGSQIYNWTSTARPGWYGHSSYHGSGAFDGSEFYLQLRVKMDPRRTTPGNSQVGKLMFLTTTRASLTSQEIVTYSGAFPVSGVGQPNYHRLYVAGSPPLESLDTLDRPGQQVGSDLANYGAGRHCSVGSSSLRQYCWAFSGGWDTLLYHVIPGRSRVAETRLVVYAAAQGRTSYTKIWDLAYSTGYTSGDRYQNGWNALLLSTYNNGLNNSEFWQRYDQIIFSKQFIPCPRV